MRYESTSSAILAVLKTHLRKRGWTALRLSAGLGVGEATAKRWLAGKGLTLDGLERMARIAGLTLGDLAREAEEAPADLAHELTLAQEKALCANIFLSFLFMTLLNGSTPAEIVADFAVPPRTMDAALARLERLALIDRLKSGKVRPLVDRTLAFRKLPLRSLFEQHMKRHFFELDYAAPDTVYTSEVVKLSRVGAAQLAELMDHFRGEVQALADRDRERSSEGMEQAREWHGVLTVMRVLDFSPMRAAVIEEWGEG